MSFPFSYCTGMQNIKNPAIVRRSVTALLSAIAVVPMAEEFLREAVDVDNEDYEDAAHYQGAVAFRADYLITRDLNDFPIATMPVLTPTQYLNLRARGFEP